MIVLCKKIAI